jgi:hypothetical protein
LGLGASPRRRNSRNALLSYGEAYHVQDWVLPAGSDVTWCTSEGIGLGTSVSIENLWAF